MGHAKGTSTLLHAAVVQILASKDSGSESKLHAVLSADGMWKVQVAACYACSRRMGSMQRVRSRGVMRMRAEPGTKEADTGSSASAQEEGDKMDLVSSQTSPSSQRWHERPKRGRIEVPWCRSFCMLQQHDVQCCCTNPPQKKRALSRAGLLNCHEVLTAHRMRTQSPLRSRQRLSGSGKQRNS